MHYRSQVRQPQLLTASNLFFKLAQDGFHSPLLNPGKIALVCDYEYV
jgi:hypothetical protein